MSRVEAVRNPDGNTWCLTFYRDHLPDMICPHASWELVELATAVSAREQVVRPSALAEAVGWVGAPALMLLANPWAWLALALGGGWHACGS